MVPACLFPETHPVPANSGWFSRNCENDSGVPALSQKSAADVRMKASSMSIGTERLVVFSLKTYPAPASRIRFVIAEFAGAMYQMSP